MQWAEDEPLIDRNHEARVFILADEFDDDDDKRAPFSNEQLNALLRSENFRSSDCSRPSGYWMPLIALFQGMRSEEICSCDRLIFKRMRATSGL